MSKTKRYLDLALQAAFKSDSNQKYRVGCIIVKKKVPIGLGFNSMGKTHPRASSYKFPFLHAELHSMIGVDATKLNGSIAYVARIKEKTGTGMAKPCECCQAELRRMGVKSVYYTMNTDDIGFIEL